MKKLMSILFFSIALVAVVLGNGIDVPTKVENAFKAKFPSIKEVAWNMDENIYTANFIEEEYAISCSFDESGNWTKTVTNLSEEDISEDIISYLGEQYDYPYIISAEKTETSKGVHFSILIEIEEEGKGEDDPETKNYITIFDENGNFVSAKIQE